MAEMCHLLHSILPVSEITPIYIVRSEAPGGGHAIDVNGVIVRYFQLIGRFMGNPRMGQAITSDVIMAVICTVGLLQSVPEIR